MLRSDKGVKGSAEVVGETSLSWLLFGLGLPTEWKLTLPSVSTLLML